MKSKPQSGVALVITLLMLSVITFLTIAFLAVSRRDRASVGVSLNDKDSRAMAEVALNRAESEIVSSMVAATNILKYDLMVSTNYFAPHFVTTAPYYTNIYNVSYSGPWAAGQQGQADWAQNIANLYYDPRPPVFVKTNPSTALDFRFWVDLNRNGRFEPSGYLPLRDDNDGMIPDTNKPGQFLMNFFKGEPEWIGMLKNPEYRHSPTNQFIGRYASLVLPIGKTLDLNFIHNYAGGDIDTSDANMPYDRYKRSQGVGSWELNLAAYLRDLNPWAYASTTAAPYTYETANSINNSGDCFQDATGLLGYRYNWNFNNLDSLDLLNSQGRLNANFKTDGIDGYSTSPGIFDFTPATDPDKSLTGKPWSGSDNPQVFTDPQELFDPTKSSPAFVNRLISAGFRTNSYDRYTFQRLLATLGADSAPELKGKININYINDPNSNLSQSNFVNWSAINFFSNTVNILLSKENFGFTITNIPVYTVNSLPGAATNYGTYLYTPAIHRILQLAANIYDATTNREFPTVFRPLFNSYKGTNFICGYTEETGVRFYAPPFVWVNANSYPFPNSSAVDKKLNVFGVPVIIGAKKYLPNFNEVSVANEVFVERKLQVTKSTSDGKVDATNQMYLFGITNAVGVELWNSYSNYVKWNVSIVATNWTDIGFANELPWATNNTVFSGTSTNLAKNTWAGWVADPSESVSNNIFVPIFTKFASLPTCTWQENNKRFSANTTDFETGVVGFPIHQWTFSVTNRLFCAIIATDDNANPHMIDFVSFATPGTNVEVMGALYENFYYSNDHRWDTNRTVPAMGVLSTTVGISEQINISPSLGDFIYGKDGGDPREAIHADARVIATTSYQANDPLVHYTVFDMLDPKFPNGRIGIFTNTFDLLTKINGTSPGYGSIGNYNSTAYKPWDGAHNNVILNDPNVRRSDDWDFPTNKFPNIGWLGRVHRGTPWQTVFLKSDPNRLTNVTAWISKRLNDPRLPTYPTNDWRLADYFTVAANDNAARGLLSVNQTNLAPWSALLSGVIVSTNSTLSGVIHPDDVTNIVFNANGINVIRQTKPNQLFKSIGDILEAPALTMKSGAFDLTDRSVTDAMVERIPQQILSLLKLGQPRFVIYSYGQSLKPAENGLYLEAGNNFRLCTNYQITGECLTRTVCHIEAVNGNQTKPKIVIDSYNIVGDQP